MTRGLCLAVGLLVAAGAAGREIPSETKQVYGLAWSLPVSESAAAIPEFLSPRWKSRQFATPLFHPPTGLIFIGALDREMRAFALDRSPVWSFSAGGAIGSVPVVGDKYLYFGADDGQLYALKPESGEQVWTHQGDAEITGPVRLRGERLYFSTALDTVYCIEAESGEYLWHVKHPQPLGISLFGNATPVLATAYSKQGTSADIVAMGYADGTLAVLDATDGRQIWRAELGRGEAFYDVDADPVVIGPWIFAASNTGGVSAYELATGTLRWHDDTEGISQLGSDGRVLVGSGAGQAIGMNPRTGKVIWRYKFDSGSASRPVFVKDQVLFNSDAGPLYVLDLFSGETLQAFGSPLGMSGQPAVQDDLLLVYSNGGTLYALSAAFAGWAHK